jgi:hypothetical protein
LGPLLLDPYGWDAYAVCIPNQIIAFILLKEEDISMIQHLSYVLGDTPGLYTMIETLEHLLAVTKTYKQGVARGIKQLPATEIHEACQNGLSLTLQIYALSL